MAVYDRWHKSRVKPGDPTCKEHDKPPTTDHGKGERWQVRWRDEQGDQKKRNFEKKGEADAYDAKVRNDLKTGDYIDPKAGKVTFRQRGDMWLGSATFGQAVSDHIAMRLRVHIYPTFGHLEMRILANQPSLIQKWIKSLQGRLAPTYIKVLFAHVSAVFSAAVEDRVIPRNPCQAKGIKLPPIVQGKVQPWLFEWVDGMRDALPERYEVMVDIGAGLGLRQGEIFGLSVEDVDFLRRVVHVRRQVKVIRGRLVYGLPKGDKERDVPLPDSVALRLSAHLAATPAVNVDMPWDRLDGERKEHRLIFTTVTGKAVHRDYFNETFWRPGLVTAGVVPPPAKGEKRKSYREHGMHALRHFYASVLLDGGESIKALSVYLGHHDPGFTLRTYTHLMPSSEDRTRKAVDAVFGAQNSPASALVVPSTGS
ncbi:tyrosine-type recombinase/integrase [Nonomuraea sp. NPDC050556]|uniref:tyrosine-type recombinase/integrase n=1 Tax=Nonomuraea sp. NPDC050556 TaxID=3364369 RepID=UPI0037A46371